MNVNWFLRMARWVRNPPSAGKVALVFAILGVCLAIAGLERLGLLPEWAALSPRGFKP